MSRIDSSPDVISREVPGEKFSATRRVLKQPSKFRYDQAQIWNFAFEKCRFSPIKMKISPIEGRSEQTEMRINDPVYMFFLLKRKEI
jgi:hypothetical protein